MGFEQLAKLRDELAKQAKAQRKEKQAADTHAAQPGKNAKANDSTKGRDARTAGKPAAKPDRKPAPARQAPKQQNPVDPVVHTIGRLQKRYPLAFPKNPAPKVALKIGILDDLLAQAGELKLSEQEVRDAVSTWCRGSRYWASLTEGASRVDLTGAETGKVTASESAFARRRSGGRTKPVTTKAGENAPAVAKPADEAAAAPGASNDADSAPAADKARG
ncbi:ProQ/FinO family protein [Paraburkholderia phymatum]|uniref:ProQ activator of osmoprotectant transporter ProP n=1 Tax=Paraburkholderia phymatum (strain DSM 17167 / CIP 108236 / LMG 21445 / STM815) TaxID=391038 RepID=B2JH34_PARP8|nr:ProQ/FinO family protein [Paraburkholderia phymatum]ACC70272.1 ProQ activator of osmoprotectant transporter ProP [Paraburkholderia phymatum STM815]